MRFSNLLIPTLKEVPNDATLASHIYLLRGGFIQGVGSGLYNFLPLGKIVLDKVRAVVKEELDAVNAQEVSLGFVTPASMWRESGRFEKYGKELLRFTDRKNNDFVLGPTHEEMMVNMVKQTVKSYKQLPLNLYQINLKFRDEIRPRFGLMRGREFLMKDGYSFHANEDDMRREFALMEETYKRIFTRLGLEFRVVEADSGAIGGSGSKEFMVLANSGEDTIVVCESCEYGANIEAAIRADVTCNEPVPSALFSKVSTPSIKTIEELSEFFKVNPYYVMKSVAMRALYDEGRSEIVLFVLRGSDTLEETKACNAIKANELVEVSETELNELGLVVGFMGAVEQKIDVKIIADNSLQNAVGMICGANEIDYHFVGASSEAMSASYDDIAAVLEGDICSCCSGKLTYTKGIEVGHIFQLGTRYSEPLKAEFLDENGKTKPFVMGTYGIGVSRLLAAIIEQHHDEKGCIWTKESSPFDLHIIVSNSKDENQTNYANSIYDELKKSNISVLMDDRKERFGFKMKDCELIGIPNILIIGQKLDDGIVELKERTEDEGVEFKIDAILTEIKNRI